MSILPTLSKILERVVFDQMERYLSQNNLLYDLQSGFRSAYSTDTCLSHLCDYIRQESEKGNYTGMVLLDLQKAFDTVDHSILLSKLQCMGFGQASLQWFKSYLSNRSQICDYDGVLSEPLQISCGVPQGSILGPLLFLIYVNDMPAAVKCKVILYADDSSLLVSGRNISQIQETLTDELSNVREWLLDNRLSLHVGKSECILFGTKHKIKKAPELKVTCNGNEIQTKTTVTYLGLTLDQTLTGHSIAEKLLNKSASKLKFLYRNTRQLDFKIKKLLVLALVQCHFDYACSAWYSGLTVKIKNKMQVMQNNMIRFILCKPSRYHVTFNDFKKVDFLPVKLRVEQLKLNHMFNIINGIAPKYLGSQIVMVHTQHTHETRASVRSCKVPSAKSVARNSFFYTGIMLWNSLPLNIKMAETKRDFKQKVRVFLWNKVEN